MANATEISSRFLSLVNRLLQRSVGSAKSVAETPTTLGHRRVGTRRIKHAPNGHIYVHPSALANQQHNRITGLDIARFGLLSIATLPFSLWISFYAWNYLKRISICEDALAQEDNEISFLLAKSKDSSKKKKVSKKGAIGETEGGPSEEGSFFGREQPLAEVRNLLSKPPHQILVVAGTNESGKSRFVAEILKGLPLSRGVTYIQLAQLVDSLSTFTHAFVRSFDLRWLQMRHSLVDVLPFAGSEILVMKERFSSRDLNQSLHVITEALKAKKKAYPHKALPVLLIDGLGEASGTETNNSSWIRSPEGRRTLERLIQWCIYVTKERQLAHIVLTGNEELVFSLTNQNRNTRGHVKVIGLADLSRKDATKLVREELPDVTEEELDKILHKFGGFIHDIRAVSREIRSKLHQRRPMLRPQATRKESTREETSQVLEREQQVRKRIVDEVIDRRFKLQIERVSAAFAKGRNKDNREEGHQPEEETEMDPYLDPLKAVYSEAQASQTDSSESSGVGDQVRWTQLQLWNTMQKLAESKTMTVPFADLRDDIFNGDTTPLLELMNEDVLGFEVENASDSAGWSWEVKPATPALARVFQHLVKTSNFKERFQEIALVEEKLKKIHEIEEERTQLRLERRRLEMRKASLAKTIELGRSLGFEEQPSLVEKQKDVYYSIVNEEGDNESRGLELRHELARLSEESNMDSSSSEKPEINIQSRNTSIRRRLKRAVLEAFDKDGSRDKFEHFQNAVAKLSSNGSGITAKDVVRIIKTTSGEDIDLESAGSFIRFWDRNNDTLLQYDEFVQMLLADESKGRPNGDRDDSDVENLDDL